MLIKIDKNVSERFSGAIQKIFSMLKSSNKFEIAACKN
jgi:hypothetical protein